ncbi:hypothetical protein CNR22_23855 [Sphingobacteriaceae bacterium]|nr:hypothetical protein CNR22_23855 [Sphingobacteriaceae bacterium]
MTSPNWKIYNWVILSFQVLILVVGLLFGKIAFGWGLGDLFWYGLIIVSILTQLILTLIFKNNFNRLRILTIIFLLFLFFISLRATIWRGSEYKWNGNIFYSTSYETTFGTIPIDSRDYYINRDGKK